MSVILDKIDNVANIVLIETNNHCVLKSFNN